MNRDVFESTLEEFPTEGWKTIISGTWLNDKQENRECNKLNPEDTDGSKL